jgi:peptide/nickel transport system permease protein
VTLSARQIATASAALHHTPGQLALAWSRFRRHRLALIGLIVLAAIAASALLADVAAPYRPDEPNVEAIREPPSASHLLGTDQIGRDQLSRLMHGGRFSLQVGLFATTVAVVLGTTVGALAGYYGGRLDNVLMRLTDVMFTLPRLLVLLLIGALFKTTVLLIVLLLGVTSWMGVARLVRASFLSLREKEFVEAARAVGVRDGAIIARHVLPNALGPVIVAGTLGVAGAILVESTLSYLGYGVQPPTPTWGNMLQNAQSEMYAAPWLAVFPGLAIFLTIMAINFVGDGLRDALDPRTTISR